MKYEEIVQELKNIGNIKTRDLDGYSRQLLKNRMDVSDLRNHVLSDQTVHRIYFQVSLGMCRSFQEQFAFIEKNAELLQDWWHVDQLTQFIIKPVDFAFAFQKAEKYVRSELPFFRRWGYVLFLTGLQKDPSHTRQILSLIKDDSAYYVQMAQAWLIADLAVFNMTDVLAFMEHTQIRYDIAGKAIQKICDSFRIPEDSKANMRMMRMRWKAE